MQTDCDKHDDDRDPPSHTPRYSDLPHPPELFNNSTFISAETFPTLENAYDEVRCRVYDEVRCRVLVYQSSSLL